MVGAAPTNRVWRELKDPLTVGTTAGYWPTCVSATSRPVKIVPRMPSWRNTSPTLNTPRAWSVAMRADVPVPHGERSMAPVHVAGLSQSSVPVETVTTPAGTTPWRATRR